MKIIVPVALVVVVWIFWKLRKKKTYYDPEEETYHKVWKMFKK